MSDVQEDRGHICIGLRVDELKIVALLKDIVLAVVLLHIGGKVVQDVLLMLAPHFTGACDICDVRRREAQVLGRPDKACLTPTGEAGPCELASVGKDGSSQTRFFFF